MVIVPRSVPIVTVRVSPAPSAGGWLVGHSPLGAAASLGVVDADGAAPLPLPLPRRNMAATTTTTTTRPITPAMAGHGIPPGPSPSSRGARAEPGPTGGWPVE